MNPNDHVEVTKALTYAQRISAEQRHERSLKLEDRLVEPLPVPTPPVVFELSLWDKIRLGPMLVPALFIIMKGLVMKDLKTTISGVVKVAFQIATIFGLALGNVDESLVTGVLWGIASIYQSFQMPDKK